MASGTLQNQNFLETIKFELKSWIFIKAKLNHSATASTFLLDTGSPCTYTFKTSKELNMKSKKFIRFGEYKSDYGYSDLEIGKVRYQNIVSLFMDNGLFNYLKVAGMIGVNAMQNSIWEINFEDTTITISDNLSHFKNISSTYLIPFKPYSEQQTPVVKLAINGNDTISAFIDTGHLSSFYFNSSFLNDSKQQANLNMKTLYCDVSENGKKLGKRTMYKRDLIQLNSLKIGDLEFEQVLAERMNLYKGKNLIGLDFLKNFIVTIDWIHFNLYLKPIAGRAVSSNLASYGFEFYKKGEVLRIAYVVKGSQAEAFGLKCEDEVYTINGQKIKDVPKEFLDLISNDIPSDQIIEIGLKDKTMRLKKDLLF